MASDGQAGLKAYVTDLHVHTVLSPCAAVEMIPPLIVRQALAKGINLTAITDHNASANVRAVQGAAIDTGLAVLPGIELQTYEEVHLLCLFDTLVQLEAWQQVVDACLPPVRNNPELFGEQFVVDATGRFIRREDRLLAISADITLKEAVIHIARLGGLAIPAHVDRPAFSLFANLGFVPPDVPIAALDISCHITPSTAHSRFPQLGDYPLIRSGDVHHLGDFCPKTVFTMAAPTLSEIRRALLGQEGRSVTIRE